MRRIVVSTFASLDGVIDAPAESTYLPFHDDEVAARQLEQLSSAGALILGRATYQSLAAAWRSQTGRFADPVNAIPKLVVSTTLQQADEWRNSTLITGDLVEEVAALKRQAGGDLLIYGCGRLARTLNEHALIDEFRFWVAPVVVGRGTRLFADPPTPIALRLTGATPFAIGTVLLTYAPAG